MAVFLLAAMIAGCGSKAAASSAEAASEETMPVILDIESVESAADLAENEESAETAEIVPTEEPEAAAAAEEETWKTAIYDFSGNGGYQIRATLTYSKIYMWDDPVLARAWESIGNGNTLPDLDGWGFEHYTGNVWMGEFGTASSESPGHSVFTRANSMYYMVGTLQFENHTEGWDLGNGDFLDTTAVIFVPDNYGKQDLIVGKMFYGSVVETYDSYLDFSAKMTGNHWGPCPFIIGFVEYFAPDYPNGEYRSWYKRDGGYLRFGDTMLDMDFWDEEDTEIQESDEPIGAADSLSVADFVSFEGITREELRSRYGTPSYDEKDAMVFGPVSFLNYPGSVKFFFNTDNGAEYMDCVSWTMDPYSAELYPAILEELKTYGSYEGIYLDESPSKIEESVIVDGKQVIVGNEQSADGNWLYVFTPYWR